MVPRGLRAATWVVPPLFAIVFYWRTLGIWFMADDFAWLGLRLSIKSFQDLLTALFAPMAQGTVRFLSERAFFLSFESLFGLNALPYRIAILVTLAGCVVLLSRVVLRLTSSNFAAIVASVAWTLSCGLAIALSWSSSFNQILVALFLFGAFLGFLRYCETGSRLWVPWVLFVAGFGALEINIMFPALAIGYALLFRRDRMRAALAFLVPSLIFAALHFLVIPKTNSDPTYKLHLDAALPQTLWTYWTWALGTGKIAEYVILPWWLPWAGTAVLTAILFSFMVFRAMRRDWLPAFGLLWFLALIAPVVPLKHHVSDYYLAAAGSGVAMLLAAMLARGTGWRIAGVVALAIYATAHIPVSRRAIQWYRDTTHEVRALVRGAEQARKLHPGKVLLLSGVPNLLFWTAIYDNPFRLLGLRVYLAPGAEKDIAPHPEWGGIDHWLFSPSSAQQAFLAEQAVVYRPVSGRLRNVTPEYRRWAESNLRDELPSRLVAGDPAFRSNFPTGFSEIENTARWMGRRAEVSMRGPQRAGQHVIVSGFAPRSLVAAGKTTLTASVDGKKLGTFQLADAHSSFEAVFPLDEVPFPMRQMRLTIECSRVVVPPDDGRELSVLITGVEIR